VAGTIPGDTPTSWTGQGAAEPKAEAISGGPERRAILPREEPRKRRGK